jgi:putative endopeptidase
MKTTLALLIGLSGWAVASAAAQAARPGDGGVPRASLPAAVALPGDDFDGYVNGAWARSHPVPADRTWIGTWPDLQSRALTQSRALVEAAVAQHAPMGVLYASYLDQPARDRQGLAPVRRWLADIDAIHDPASLAVEIGRLARIDVGALFIPVVEEDDGRPGRRLLNVRQAGLGLPDAAAYRTTDGAGRARREAYRTFLVAMLSSLGIPLAEAEVRVDAVLAWESRLAEVQTSRVAQRDASSAYHPMTVRELERRIPGFAWRSWLAALGATTVERLNVPHPESLRTQWAMVLDTPVAVLRDHLRLRLLGSYSRYLDARMAAARFAYYGTAVRGTSVPAPSWRGGLDLVTNLMPEELGRAYVGRYFAPSAKAQARAIAGAVRTALDARVSHATWLSAGARAEVREKLRRTRLSIGYPDVWPRGPAVALRDDDLAGNVARLVAARFDRAIAELGQPIDRAAWSAPVSVPNAYASAAANEVIFPAALLQPPLFDPAADAAVNYARLGATMGHELSHLFDDQGRRYDADGRLRETWTPADARRFDARAQALVEQMESYTPLPGERINGTLVLGEALADLAGLQAAHDAYAAGAPTAGQERRRADRRFFVAWAQLWRSNYQPAYLRTLLRTDAHPPGAARLSTVRNLDAWYEAFDVSVGARLYVAPAARIRVW